MIHYVEGNILESSAQALVNTVNTVGVMGKGIALQFKNAFPQNFRCYAKAYKAGDVRIGQMFLTKDENLATGEKTIINFPTKTDWRKPSEYAYIEQGLADLVRVIQENNITSLALPPLGAGNGGLDWERVRRMIEEKLSCLDADVYIYQPNYKIKEVLKKERAKLTDARALMLFVLHDLVKQGEFVSEFSSEKVCYFLQRFGARKYFNLDFKPDFYGPYSGKVRHVLYVLNGSYIMGYSDKDRKPFEPLVLVSDAWASIEEYIINSAELREIVSKTTCFLRGFYSDFALELLSTVDYITLTHNTFDRDAIINALDTWSNRKRSLFSNHRYIDISLKRLEMLQAESAGADVNESE
jgi:O-acetyl-ADP-ribose deacetylase (regulator of RNase III)